jgi:hypothetical protein
MRCGRCGRTMQEPAGWVAGLPVGPVCYVRLVPREAHSVSLRVVRADQPELWDECFFSQAGDADRIALESKHA